MNMGRLRVGAAVGVTYDTVDRVKALTDAGADAIVIDTAHGHSLGVLKAVKDIRKKFKYIQLIVGNIATYEAALDLLIVKLMPLRLELVLVQFVLQELLQELEFLKLLQLHRLIVQLKNMVFQLLLMVE